MLVTSREKRRNAGAKMAKLLATEDCDDFYKSTYGGFFEEENDEVFSSPAETSSDESFDSEEGEEAGESEQDEDEDRPKRKRGRVVTKAYKFEPVVVTLHNKVYMNLWEFPVNFHNKKLQEPALGKPDGKHFFRSRPQRERKIPRGMKYYKVYSQKERLQIAKETEIENLSSLEDYRKFELEKKAKARVVKRKDLSHLPHIRFHSTLMPSTSCDVIDRYSPCDIIDESRDPGERSRDDDLPERSKVARAFISFTDGETYKKECPFGEIKRKRREPLVKFCVVSGMKAKYICPLTGLPYANIEAFKVLRRNLAEFVAAKAKPEDNVTEWIEKWGVKSEIAG